MSENQHREPVDETEDQTSRKTWVGLFRSNGEMVKRYICEKEVANFEEIIDKSELPSGNYIVIIQSPVSILTERFSIS